MKERETEVENGNGKYFSSANTFFFTIIYITNYSINK